MTLELPSNRTAVMGIINVTPDSFYDGGEYNSKPAAIERAETLVDEGADIIDIGGESTRDGADPVNIGEEISRIEAVTEQVAELDVQVSIDTRKHEVAERALEAGADIINDVSGFRDPKMAETIARYDAGAAIMHSINAPIETDHTEEYDDVVETVVSELSATIEEAEAAGLSRDKILVDPGLHFGKNVVEDFEMLGSLERFRELGCPLLIGHSHKKLFLLVGAHPKKVSPTVALTALLADEGVEVVRVHEVKENINAIRLVQALDEPRQFLR